MFPKKFFFLLCISCLALSNSFIFSQEHELLKTTDVSKVMKQIFDQHVDQKVMSGTILKHALRVYIDQFDPFRIYLLEDEVAPYLNVTDSQMEQWIQQYRYNDFSMFASLNGVIQQAVDRARLLRKEIQDNRGPLFKPGSKELKNHEEWMERDPNKPFPKTVEELKSRIKSQFIHFIAEEKKRFGKNQVLTHEPQTLAIFDHYLANHENTYLYQTDEGQPIAGAQKENLFVLHILKALASSLDAHTTFYNNAEAYDMKVRLEKEFEGVGIVLQQESDGAIIITKLLNGGPAAKSGLVQAKDRIISIDGQKVADRSLNSIMEMIRGANGTPVTLVLQRKIAALDGAQTEKSLEVTLKREPIAVNEDRVDYSFDQFGDGIIGKITLHAFYQGENGVSAENDVRNAIKELSKKGHLRGLILDLRDNSGGFLTQAVKVAGIFITNGVVVISKYSDGHERYYRDMDGKLAFNGPLLILTSKATASAAEIVAQALQDYGVAIVAGDDRTYGKGTIQSQTVTDENAASFFKVTIGKYYTVSGKTPQIQGVKSDILVPGPYSQEKIGEKYLDYSLANDSITPEYKDDLADIDPGLRAWYLRYYIPTIQQKRDFWSEMLPTLQKNSEYRIAHNKNYQAFLKQLKGGVEEEDSKDSKEGNIELGTQSKGKGNFGEDDLQMAEAVNIVKDMIMLHPNAQMNAYAKKFSNAPEPAVVP